MVIQFLVGQHLQGPSSTDPRSCHLMVVQKVKSAIIQLKSFSPIIHSGFTENNSDRKYGGMVLSSVYQVYQFSKKKAV